MSDTYQAPPHGWTCFHCGETFTTMGSARDHFGADPSAEPGCMVRVQFGQERGLLMALRKAEQLITELRAARLTNQNLLTDPQPVDDTGNLHGKELAK